MTGVRNARPYSTRGQARQSREPPWERRARGLVVNERSPQSAQLPAYPTNSIKVWLNQITVWVAQARLAPHRRESVSWHAECGPRRTCATTANLIQNGMTPKAVDHLGNFGSVDKVLRLKAPPLSESA